MVYILIIVLIFILLYFFAILGRTGFTDFKDFKDVRFAHRGLHSKVIPENSLWAFKSALDNGYGAEFDVRLTKDEKLVVIHDSSLLRTAGFDLKVEDLTLDEISKFTLEGTNEKIPTLKEVLDLFQGKQPIIIELKPAENVDTLCRLTEDMLKTYDGAYCIESFDPRCVKWFKKHSPQTVRGQLSENYFVKSKSKLPFCLKFALVFLLTNFLTKPDFIAYRFSDRKNLSFKICTKLYGIHGVCWTVKGEDIKRCENENLIPIFEEEKRQ